MSMYEIASLLGGLALFLYGLHMTSEKLERALGGGLKRMLPRKNRVSGLLAGTVLAGALQSSSAVTVLAVGFVQAGAMSLKSAAGVILGANIGTTTTALLLSLPCLPGALLATVGMLLALLFRRERVRQAGYALLGASILLIGMQWMTDAMAPLKSWNGMKYLMLGLEQPLLAVLLGAGVAAILQSSAATVGILQALAVQGLLPLQTAFYVLLGANIGTCMTVVIASAGANVAARRAAAVHLLFNVITAAAMFEAAQYWPLMDAAARAGDNVKLQLALVHVMMNGAAALVFLPFAGILCALTKLFVHGRQQEKAARFYDERMLSVPSVALAQLEKETEALCGRHRQQMKLAVELWQGDATAGEMQTQDDLAQTITEGLLQVRGKLNGEKDALRIKMLLTAVAQSQQMGDHARKLCELREKYVGMDFGEEAMDDLLLMAHKALNMADMAQQALFGGKMSGEKQQSMQLMAREMQDCLQEAQEQHLARMTSGACSAAEGIAYMEALHHAACAAMHAGKMA